MPAKPFSQACENNKAAILTVLQAHLRDATRVLEIGSGTGQHAIFFAEHLPHLHWQTSDLAEHHAGIREWLKEFPRHNLLSPLTLNVATSLWDFGSFDGVFTANTLHIMAWDEVLAMLDGVAKVLCPQGKLVIYGPFNYRGQFTSPSNARFNEWLQAQAPHRAIRDFEALCAAASARGLRWLDDIEMPANNRCLVFVRD